MKVHMKFCLLTLPILMTLAMADRSVHAQQWYNEIKIHGVPISCTADGGKKVPLIISDQARKWGGGYAHTDPVKGPTLMLSPTYLNTLPRLAAFNLFYHECAHLALPMGVGLGNPEQEKKADCYAVREMRKHGLISSWEDFKEATAYLRTLKATGKGHRPGPERVKMAARCAKIPVMTSGASLCRDLDRIFAGGKEAFESDGGNKRVRIGILFGKKDCTYDTSYASPEYRCSREFGESASRRERALAFGDRTVREVKKCLPSNFEFRSFGERNAKSIEYGLNDFVEEWWEGGIDTKGGHMIQVRSNSAVNFIVVFPK